MLTQKQIVKIRKDFNGTLQRIIFKVLGDKNRYRIFEILAKQSKLGVGEIANILNISLPLASQHLKILEQADVLIKEKSGQKTYYKISETNVLAQAVIKEII